MSLGFILAVLSGTAAGAFVSGLSGFAFGMVALSVWAWALDPRLISPLIVFGSLVSQLMSLGAVRRGFSWRHLMPFLIGGVLGVPLGVWLLGVIDLAWFRAVTGALLIVYATGALLARELPAVTRGGRLADGVIGWIGGIMGGLAGLSGPVPVLWCTLRRWERDTQRAVFQSFNTAVHVFALTGYFWNGILTETVGWTFALMLPAIVLPTWLGTRLYRHISEAAFRRVILLLLPPPPWAERMGEGGGVDEAKRGGAYRVSPPPPIPPPRCARGRDDDEAAARICRLLYKRQHPDPS